MIWASVRMSYSETEAVLVVYQTARHLFRCCVKGVGKKEGFEDLWEKSVKLYVRAFWANSCYLSALPHLTWSMCLNNWLSLPLVLTFLSTLWLPAIVPSLHFNSGCCSVSQWIQTGKLYPVQFSTSYYCGPAHALFVHCPVWKEIKLVQL